MTASRTINQNAILEQGFMDEQTHRLIADMKEIDVPQQLIVRTLALLSEQQQTISDYERRARINRQTGLFSRYALEEKFPEVVSTLRRANHGQEPQDHKFGLMVYIDMIDLSLFNRFGHHVGDAAIEITAHALRNLCRRATDLAVRPHETGDEFILVFPEVDHTFRESIVHDNLRDVQQGLIVETPEGPSSIGFRYHTHPITHESRLEEIMRQADPKAPENAPHIISLHPQDNDTHTSYPAA